jgi:hypothetical protein
LIALLAFASSQASAQSAPVPESPAPAPAPAPALPSVAELLARYAREPSVERVVEAALAALPKPRAAGLASRARDAGWVPSVGLRARRGQGVDWSQTLGEQTIDIGSDDDLTLEASLTFDLDRVIFRSEEVALARQAQAEQDARKVRVREVIALYFERRKLQLERDRAPAPDVARSVRIAEIEALLDVFTAGTFSRMMPPAA